VAFAKADTSKAEEMLSNKNADQAAWEKRVQLLLEELSASFGGELQ
jgi:hypothetical protein